MSFLFKRRKKEEKKEDWLKENLVGELAIDAYETPKYIVIQSPIAGITPRDIEISLEDGMLIIKGKRQRPESTDKIKKYFYQECFWGNFEKKLILPKEVDITKARASMKNGVLTLKIPKLKEKEKEEIKVEVEEE
ncbi:MAG: Hsp20/alpha crystallin family protein [Candidatus Pacebacteria bacterium]|nr:Hsp20/alpha crystallin family protein [Candidatus Paceibacterota bacterium]